MATRSSAAFAFIVLFATAAARGAGLPTVELSVNGHRLVAEVAATGEDHGRAFPLHRPTVAVITRDKKTISAGDLYGHLKEWSVGGR